MAGNDKNVAVIGAGKMGLPLACQFAKSGAQVIACDINPNIVNTINQGLCPIDEPQLAELLAEVVAKGRLKATVDTSSAVAQSEVVVVIVPAVLTAERQADTAIIKAVSREISKTLRAGSLVSYETTLPVGGTRALLPILESTGLRAGEDFDLVFSPERVKSQYVLNNLTKTSKVVGGINASAAARAAKFYQAYLGVPVISVESLEAAELVKLAGMVYRDVNIALANELSCYADTVGVDIMPVLAAANTDGEAALLSPGIGVGGHCTPVYPYFLIHDAQRLNVPIRLAERSRLINDQQVAYLLKRLEQIWHPLRSRTVLILGLGFRPQVKESLFSPAFLLRDELLLRQAKVILHDPLFTASEIREQGFEPGTYDLRDSALPEVLILNTAHDVYRELNFKDMALRGLKVVVDGRNLWQPEQVTKAGLIYLGIGRGSSHKIANQPVSVPTIPVAKPLLGEREAQAASCVINSGWVLQGPQVAAFESEFANCVGAPYACAVSSGTAALHLALKALGVKPGDEVITVSHSFIATANSISYCGAIPVFVDIQPHTFNINPELIEEVITEKTKAILCVHQMGMPCDLKAITEIAKRHSLFVVEDAACALGSEVLWQQGHDVWEKIGKPHGDIACFSFHPRKLLTTGEGGMVTTSNASWDRQIRLWRSHGVLKGATEVYQTLGYNYRMTDIQAAVGRAQLQRLPGILEERRLLAKNYDDLLATRPEFIVPYEPAWAASNWQSYCVGLPEGVKQKLVIQAMLNNGIGVRPGIMCAHREPAYEQEPWLCLPPVKNCACEPAICARLSISERVQDHTIILPIFSTMTESEQQKVFACLVEACKAPA